MTVTLPWAPWNGQKPLRRAKHGTATEVEAYFHRSPTGQLDGATLLLDPLKIPFAVRRLDASRRVATKQRERACLSRRSLFGHEFQERGCCVASSKWLELVWLGKTETSICAGATMACASSPRSCCDVRDPCDAGRGLQCDPERQHLRSCSRTLLISS